MDKVIISTENLNAQNLVEIHEDSLLNEYLLFGNDGWGIEQEITTENSELQQLICNRFGFDKQVYKRVVGKIY